MEYDQHNHVSEQAVVTRAERQPTPLVDNAGGITYHGYAPLGTPEDAMGWLITRTSTVGSVTRTDYANGRMAYNSSWSLRAVIQYAR